jgi:DNA replication protein DnaC
MTLNTKDSFWKWVCPEPYRSIDIVQLEQKLRNKGYDVKSMQEVLEWPYGSHGLVVSGPAAAGKSRLIWPLLRRLLFEEDRSAAVLDAVTFRRQLQTAIFDEWYVEYVKCLARAQIMYLDNLGQMHLTEAGAGFLLHVPEKRVSECRPILATTRCTGEELAMRRGGVSTRDAVCRRLNEFCRVVQVRQAA